MHVVLEDGVAGCMGVRTTPGSANTSKELVGGSLEPGGTALFRFTFPTEFEGNPGQSEWEITDCVFLNDSPFQKYTVTFVPNDIGVQVIEFPLTIPADTPIGSEYCNYAKTTATPSAPQASNRKAGPACFIVGGAIRVLKVDDAGAPLPGATFSVACTWPTTTAFMPDTILSVPTNGTINGGASSETIDSTSGGSFTRTVVTGSLGAISVNGPIGTACTFTETAAPGGYLPPAPPNNVRTLTIVSATQATHTFVNTQALPDVTVAKTASTSAVESTETYSYTITASNIGTGAANNVTVVDDLDDDLIIDSVTPSQGSCDAVGAGNSISCNLGTLAAGASATVILSVTATVDVCPSVQNQASVSASNEPAANEGNNLSDTVSVAVNCPGLNITKTPDGEVVNAGDQISFSITATNNGPGVASDVELSDQLPAGFDWELDPANADCSISAGGLLGCDIGDMAAGASFSVSVIAETSFEDCAENAYLNTATADAGNHAQVSDTGDIRIDCPELDITKIADDSVVSAGENIGFTIMVTNLGPGQAYDVTLTDALPGGLAWTDDSADCTIVDNTLECEFGDLSAGASASVHVSAPTTGEHCATLQNTAFADASNNPDGPIDASAEVTIECPGLNIAKTADSGVINAGDVAAFEVIIWNAGPGQAFGVTFSDTVPGTGWSLNLLNADDDDACIGAVVAGEDREEWSCTFGTLDASPMADGKVIRLTKTTDFDDCGLLDNTAVADAANDDAVDDSATIRVDCPVPSLVIDKSASVEQVEFTLDEAGNVTSVSPAVVTWTLSWTLSNGPVANAVISDPIPASLSYVPGSASDGGVFDAATNTLSWTFAELSASGSVTFQTTVDEDAAGEIVNVATIVSDQTPEDEGVDSITVSEQVVLGPTPPLPPKVPDTAAADWVNGQPGTVLPLAALALLLSGSLAGLAAANVRSARRRR